MSLFQLKQSETILSIPQHAAKNEKFRCQIRRRHHDEKFRSVRRQLIQSLKSLSFLQQLKSERDNFHSRKIHWLIDGLQNGKNKAIFYQDMSNLRLQPYLCDMANNKQINLEDKTKIINSLVQLTYFMPSFCSDFNESKFIDEIRQQINKLNLCNETQYNYAYYVGTLIQNLTSFMNKQFNHFMIESDFLLVFKNLLYKQVHQPTYNSNLRLIMLKIYKNLLHSHCLEQNFVCKTLVEIMKDSQNYLNADMIEQIFICLEVSTKIQGFWQYLISKNVSFGLIMHGLQDIVNILATNFNQKSFEGLVNFLNHLTDYKTQVAMFVQDHIFSWIRQMPDKKFFLNSLKKLRQNQESGPAKRIICKTLKILSNFDHFDLFYENKTEQGQFIQIILAKFIFTNNKFGKYAVSILTNILIVDKSAIDMLIDYGIIDGIKDFLECKFFQSEMAEIIELAEQLVDIEEQLKQKGTENKIVNVFHARGIVREIEQLQNNPNRQVYKRAEEFMNRLHSLSQSSETRK